jgi:hypothetical protein
MAKEASNESKSDSASGENHGEGNPEAGREYQERTRSFVGDGKVPKAAKEAERAMSDEDEKEKLERARKQSSQHG